jgi:hypothetical protein
MSRKEFWWKTEKEPLAMSGRGRMHRREFLVSSSLAAASGGLGLGFSEAGAQEPPASDRWTRWAQPLAQDFVAVHRVRDLEAKDRYVCVGSPDILRLPSGRLLASMELWLQIPPHITAEGGIASCPKYRT